MIGVSPGVLSPGSHRTAPADFATNATPVPLVMMVMTGTGDVQEDASETGVSKLCLHNEFHRLELEVVSGRSVHNQ